MNDYNFGNFLCMLREQKGLTQAEIAQMLSVTPAAVSKWENGESKPRIETLFQLAEILDVTAEELMAGKFLRAETPDDEQVEEIRKRYEYLTRIDSLLTTSVRIKRIVANLIDWNIIGLPILLLNLAITVYSAMNGKINESNEFIFGGFLLFSIAVWFVSFMLRDFICKGRSLGKRILGLIVINRNNGEKATKKQLVLRNIFLFIEQIDGIIMLVRGISIGDSVAQTLVVSKEQWEEQKNGAINTAISQINLYRTPKADTKKIIALLAVVFIVFVGLTGLFVGGVFSSLEKVKETETYQVAHNYLIESGTLENHGISEEELELKAFSLERRLIGEKSFVEFGFYAKGIDFIVICHEENDWWYVCEECTSAGTAIVHN